MNRRGFVATIAGLLGALGLRGQNPNNATSGTIASWGAKNYFCQSLDFREQPCPEEQKAGEEYCPLGHSQKPRMLPIREMVGEYVLELTPELHVCSVCGVVYLIIGKK